MCPTVFATGTDPLPTGYAWAWVQTLQAMAGVPEGAVAGTMTRALDDLVDGDAAPLAGQHLGQLAALVTRDQGLSAALEHLDADSAGRHRLLWTALVRSGPGLVCHAPAVVADVAAWLLGDLPCAERARQLAASLAPEHWGTQLLARLLDDGAQPGAWPSVVREPAADAGRGWYDDEDEGADQ